jgi:uncharacterized membrane protein YbhN (UPF0104 family)
MIEDAPAPPRGRRVWRIVAAIVVVAVLAWYVCRPSVRGQLAALLHIHPKYLLPMIAVPLLSYAVNGWIGRELALEFAVKLRFVEWYGLAVVNSLANYLPLPQAGAVARGVYLKRVHQLPYGPFAATLVVTYATALSLYGFAGLAGLGVLANEGRRSPPVLWLVFAALALTFLFVTPAARLFPLPKKYAHLHDHLASLRRHHLLGRIILLQASLAALTSTGLWLACKTLHGGEAVTWPQGAMLGLIMLASGVANVTPGNVGVEQFAAEVTGRLLGLPANMGLAASAIFRAVSLGVTLVAGPILSAMLAREKPVNGLQPNGA